jgi:hypothetical protein
MEIIALGADAGGSHIKDIFPGVHVHSPFFAFAFKSMNSNH